MAAVSSPVIVSDAQRQQLEEEGFFITGVLFDEPTLAGLRGEFQRFWDEHIAGAEQTGDPLTIEQARYRPFIARLHLRSPICHAFCRHPAILDICRQIIGPDVDTTWNQTILKPPQRDSQSDNAFAWHQDQWYALKGDYAKDSNLDILREPNNAITLWVAVSRTTVDNGTLWVLPGRHKEGLLPHVWSESRREWQGQFDTSWKIPAVMKAGQMLVFRKYLPHGSGPNVSSEVRMAYQIGYTVPGLKLHPSEDLSPVLRGGQVV